MSQLLVFCVFFYVFVLFLFSFLIENLLSSEAYGNARVEELRDHCLTNSLLTHTHTD